MKTKNDMPHLEKLRYDYQLLHETYSLKRPMRSAIESAVVLAGMLAGVLYVALTL